LKRKTAERKKNKKIRKRISYFSFIEDSCPSYVWLWINKFKHREQIEDTHILEIQHIRKQLSRQKLSINELYMIYMIFWFFIRLPPSHCTSSLNVVLLLCIRIL